jgi:hypothetical protein
MSTQGARPIVLETGPGCELEPHLPVARLPEDGWAYAPTGSMLACLGGARVVCHACGEQLTAISADHLRRAVGQQMVRTGVLYVLGAAAQPVGTRSGASRPVRTGGAPCPGRVMATAPDRE